ncbi:EEF1A lysine methyltransferase 4 [Vanrija pseudolonga]|uniref:EEF1A lysine methyltransferase 4 n=1 Tax=Vanrija pseudolonga TaxID=143232 RepID=A0AAF0Y0T3_9TREE|nr:EEF1A lysine methyltransferase 4 [Vanrija pseudolonga]
MTVDYSSKVYWEDRLSRESAADGFEWLVPSDVLIPVVHAALPDARGTRPLNLLHFGCGTSSLGIDVQHHLGGGVRVVDSDYASSALRDTQLDQVPLMEMDMLSLPSLLKHMPPDGWDVLLDKSTADAISCGPAIPATDTALDRRVDAIEHLCHNAARVTRVGGRWICASYSSSRFDFLRSSPERPDRPTTYGWRIIDKVALVRHATKTSADQQVVYHPETGIWAWVLERE